MQPFMAYIGRHEWLRAVRTIIFFCNFVSDAISVKNALEKILISSGFTIKVWSVLASGFVFDFTAVATRGQRPADTVGCIVVVLIQGVVEFGGLRRSPELWEYIGFIPMCYSCKLHFFRKCPTFVRLSCTWIGKSIIIVFIKLNDFVTYFNMSQVRK